MKFILLLILIFESQLFANGNISLHSNWKFKNTKSNVWLDAKVPGTVHTDLLDNNIIPNPFFGANETKVKWVENEDWEYVTYFDFSKTILSNQQIELIFEGLDTYAFVTLNDSLILQSDNMFREYKLDVKNILKENNNKLHILFKSSVIKGKEELNKLSYKLPGDEKVFTRKAQYQYGWDWGPRLVTSGIWKNIRLHYFNNATLADINIIQSELTKNLAKLKINYEINCQLAGDYNVSVNSELENLNFFNKFINWVLKFFGISKSFNTQTFNLVKGVNNISLDIEIKNPEFWWTNGLGKQNLYKFISTISYSGELLENVEIKKGLRTIKLIRENDSVGQSFYFKLNGVPVFMKGANWIPADNFIPRISESKYVSLIQKARDANMNMLRVSGAGIYEPNIFYELCDKYGILVWQDFMFSISMYPGDSLFLKAVRAEVVDNVKRLRNYTSLAIWCGNNEINEGWHNWGWQKQFKYSVKDSTIIWNNYKYIFENQIPEIVDSLDSDRDYWPSSPLIGWGKKESLTQGDMHYWGVWWGEEPFDKYNYKIGRFMSEYGFQGMPNFISLKKYIPDDELKLNSPSLKAHQKHPTGDEFINKYMVREFNLPTNLENYSYVSQLLQADGIKTAIHSHRRAKPYCMGTLFWQFNDCWPVTSWSAVDYYKNDKALYYEAKRSYENVITSVIKNKINYDVFIISDLMNNLKTDLQLKLIDFHGNVLWKNESEIKVEANSSKIYFSLPESTLNSFNKNNIVLVSNLGIRNNFERYLYYFDTTKNLALSKPKININQRNKITFEITSNVLAKNIYLSEIDNEIELSDNFFDLLPGERKIITSKKEIDKSKIKIKSLVDTY